MNDRDQLMTLDEVADFLRLPKNTMYRWRTQGTGPRGIRVGRHLRYRRDDVLRWVEGRYER